MPAAPRDVDDADVELRTTVTLDGDRGDLHVTADRIVYEPFDDDGFLHVDATAVDAVEHRRRPTSPHADTIGAAGLVAASALVAYSAVNPGAAPFAAIGILAALYTSARAFLLRPKRLRINTESGEYAFGNIGPENARTLANAIRDARE